MTTDVKLLPLPNSGSGFYEDNVWHDTFSKRQMESYARANMEPLLAENERLRAEVEALRYSNGTNATCAGTFKAEAAEWRAAFVAERAMRYRTGGMAIEQARIHAETDAARMAAGQQASSRRTAMDNTSCAQTEDQYAAKEAEFLRIWNTASGSRAHDQYHRWRIPSWYNAPAWAQWIRFCADRGWVFAERKPYVYDDGVVSAHNRLMRACEVPGVLFFDNPNNVMGGEAPFWVTDRRKKQGGTQE